MRTNTHNGFILKFDGYTFPACRSNQITKDCYFLMGGLANERLYKVRRNNGSHYYETYHNISRA